MKKDFKKEKKSSAVVVTSLLLKEDQARHDSSFLQAVSSSSEAIEEIKSSAIQSEVVGSSVSTNKWAKNFICQTIIPFLDDIRDIISWHSSSKELYTNLAYLQFCYQLVKKLLPDDHVTTFDEESFFWGRRPTPLALRSHGSSWQYREKFQHYLRPRNNPKKNLFILVARGYLETAWKKARDDEIGFFDKRSDSLSVADFARQLSQEKYPYYQQLFDHFYLELYPNVFDHSFLDAVDWYEPDETVFEMFKHAVWLNQMVVVTEFIERGFNIDAEQPHVEPMLRVPLIISAAISGDALLTKTLLDHGARANIRFGERELLPVELTNEKVVIQLLIHALIKEGVNVNTRIGWYHLRITFLHWAAQEGDETLVNMLLSRHANLNIPAIVEKDDSDEENYCDGGETAVQAVTERGHCNIALTLLAHGADFRVKTSSKRTLLHLACSHHRRGEGNAKLIQVLLDKKLDPNARDLNRQTPLHDVIGQLNLEGIRLLIANKADINAKDKWGYTPLSIASQMKNEEREEVIALLLGQPSSKKLPLVSSCLEENKAEHKETVSDFSISAGKGCGSTFFNSSTRVEVSSTSFPLSSSSVMVSVDQDLQTKARWLLDKLQAALDFHNDVLPTDIHNNYSQQLAEYEARFEVLAGGDVEELEKMFKTLMRLIPAREEEISFSLK